MMTFLCYPTCSTCKKAKAFLDEKGILYEMRPIHSERPSVEELRLWQEKSGLPLKRFFNTSGQKYRAMELSSRLSEMSEEEQLTLLASDGMLVRRPILVMEHTVLVGFRAGEWEAALAENAAV